MIFLTGIIAGMLFATLQIFPPLAVAVSIYKIKKLGALGIREHLIVNCIALAIVSFVDLNFSIVYLAFLVPEFGYYFILKRLKRFPAFDRIIMVSFVSSIVFFLAYYLIFKNSGVSFQMIRDIYEKNVQLNPQDLDAAFIFIRDYSFYLTFIYSFFTVFFICFFFNYGSFKYWEISYLWVIPYIAIFFLKYFKLAEGIYVENALKILQVIFVPYGMKSLYLTILSFSKIKLLSRIAIILIFIYNPQLFFIYGVISSGGNKKITN